MVATSEVIFEIVFERNWAVTQIIQLNTHLIPMSQNLVDGLNYEYE